MKYRTIKLIYPCESRNSNLVSFSISKIPFTKADMSIYDTVDFFEKNVFSKIKKINKRINNNIQLKDIVNLHNSDGIKDFSQIKSMLKQIKMGKEVLSSSGAPNIKLAKTNGKELVLFDGHHSILAYMACGKRLLSEVPHLVVYNEDNENVTDDEILVFFGEHRKELKGKNWRDYVINWQVPKEKQICRRLERNMGELFGSVRTKINAL